MRPLTTLVAFAIGALAFTDRGLIRHEGKDVGREVPYKGVTLYVSKPRVHEKKTAVIYLTDLFGLNLTENRLLADSFARAGFLTIAPDLFDGEPAPVDLNDPSFDIAEFLSKHPTDAVDAKISKAIAWAKGHAGCHTIAVTGYCFGGRFSFRFLADGKGADLGFAAHPSLLLDDEISDINGPISLAQAETDELISPERRHEMEALLSETDQPYQVSLFSGTSHGFGVRANVSDPQQRFAKEAAFYQAVQWFDSWA